MNLDPSRDTDFPPPAPSRPEQAVDAGRATLLAAHAQEGAAIPGGGAEPGNGIPALGSASLFRDGSTDGFASAMEDAPGGGADPRNDLQPLDPASLFGNGTPLPDTPFDGLAADFEDALVEGLSGDAATSSGYSDLEGIVAALDPTALNGNAGTRPQSPARGSDARAKTDPGTSSPSGPIAALAFATDRQTEDALRQGFLHFRNPSPHYQDPQVWNGGIRTAVTALTNGHSTQLVIVDVDGTPYPAGAIHELAEVCEVGTAVVAIGSDGTARSSRELLLAGVSDYLVKPVTAAAVQETVARISGSDHDGSVTGKLVGFVGTGGSGATTLVAATALQAALRGRYVSVLDLNRTVATSAVLLDVDPAAGLDQLLEVAAGPLPDPQMLDGVRVQRSERISLYAYRWNLEPPPIPSPRALEWLIGELKQRSQLVLVDGLDDPALRFAVLEQSDIRVVVAEPTVRDVLRSARIVDLLGGREPTLRVRNHTREFRRGTDSGSLAGAATNLPADVEIPFEPSLPAIADRGWPEGRMPRQLRQPLAGLTDRLLTEAAAATAALSRGG